MTVPGPSWPPFLNLAKYAGGTSLQVIDETVWEVTGKADPTGTATMQSDPIGGDELWIGERLNVDSNSLYTGRLDVYEGTTPGGLFRRAWTPVPYRYPVNIGFIPGLLFRPGTAVLAQVTGLIQNDVILLALTYVKVKKVLHPR